MRTREEWLEAAYRNLPVALQNLACSAYGAREARVRLGGGFRRHLDSLSASEWWDGAQIESFQDSLLADTVAAAYENVPLYRTRMEEAGLKPADIRRTADLAKLPLLTKQDVRDHATDLVSRAAKRRSLVPRHTSGTTGTSLHFFCPRSAIALQWAVWWRHRMRFGLRVDDWHLNFTGKLLVPPEQARPPYWRWSRPMRQALVTMHHLTPEKVPAIADFIDQQAFAFYSGYPSIIHAFALSMLEAGLVLERRPSVVATGAENVLDHQRRDIRAVTGAVITDQYGLSEGCGNASQCPELVYHEDFEFGIIECVDPTVMEDGTVQGRIVCTGFANRDFPFIRYDTGDVGLWSADGVNCACGRKSRTLVRIEGRIDDFVITPEGRRIMRFDYVFKDTSNIRASQIVQERLGEVKVRIVRSREYSERDERYVAEQIARWISPRLAVTFEYVDQISGEGNGKFRAVRSLLHKTGEEV